MEASFKVYSAGGCSYCGDSADGSGHCYGCGSYIGVYECKVSDAETDQELFTVVGESRKWVIGQARKKLRELKRETQDEQDEQGFNWPLAAAITAGIAALAYIIGKYSNKEPPTTTWRDRKWQQQKDSMISDGGYIESDVPFLPGENAWSRQKRLRKLQRNGELNSVTVDIAQWAATELARKHQEILASLPNDNDRRVFEQLWPAYDRNLKEATKRGEQFAKSLPRVRV